MIEQGVDLEKSRAKVLRRFQQAEQFRQPLEAKWLNYFRLYRSYVEDQKNNRAGRANLFVPETFSHIETIAPRLVETAFATRPYVGVLPRPKIALPQEQLDLLKDHARAKELLMDYQLADRIDIHSLASRWFRDSLIYGMAPAKVTWKREVKERRRWAPDQSPMSTIVQKVFGTVLRYVPQAVSEVVYDDPDMELVDIFDFYWDPQATDIDKARYVIQRTRVSMEHLKKMAEQGIYEGIEDIKPSATVPSEPKESRLGSIGLDFLEPDPQEPDIELLEYWEDDRVITLANREKVIRDEPNPFWHGKKPYAAAIPVPDQTQLCGISLVEPIVRLQYELNDVRNQRMDRVTLQLNRMWKVRRAAEVDENDLTWRANGIIYVDEMDDVEPIEHSDVQASGYNEEQLIRDDMQRATGAYDIMRGAPTPRRSTATEVATRSELGSFRFKDMLRNIENSGLRRVAQLIGDLNEQFIDRARLVRIIGPIGATFPEVSPEEVRGDFDYVVVGSAVEPIANKDIRRQELIQLYQTVAADPMLKRDELLKMLLGAFDVQNPAQFILPPAPPVPPAGPEMGPLPQEGAAEMPMPMPMEGAMMGG